MSETKKTLTDSERTEKLKALLTDKAFVEGLVDKVSPEDAQKYFAENGLELSHEEIMGLGKALNQLSARKDVELSDEELADVAGGSWWGDALTIVGAIAGTFGGSVLGGFLIFCCPW